eukprot:scaffold3418_cov124-Isochrysis_galbana.AAC.31
MVAMGQETSTLACAARFLDDACMYLPVVYTYVHMVAVAHGRRRCRPVGRSLKLEPSARACRHAGT